MLRDDTSFDAGADVLESSWPYFLTHLICLIYLSICILSTKQAVDLIRTGSKLLSFRFLFLALACVWTALRIGFLAFSRLSVSQDDQPVNQSADDSLSDSTALSHSDQSFNQSIKHILVDLSYYLPASCQLAMFSLVLTYYMKLYHSFLFDWRIVQSKIVAFFISFNVLYFLCTVAFVVTTHIYHPTANQSLDQSTLDRIELYHQCHFLLSALSFAVLLVVSCVYFWWLLTNTTIPRYYLSIDQSFNQSNNRSISLQYLYIPSLVFIVCVLFTRFVFDGAAALNIAGVFRRQIYETSHGVGIDKVTFCLLFAWEIVPTLMVIFGFQDRPVINQSNNQSIDQSINQTTNKSLWSRMRGCLSFSPPPVIISPVQPSEAQTRDQYDAEAALDEEEALLGSSLHASLVEKPCDEDLSMFSSNLLLGSSSQPERLTFYQHMQGYGANQAMNYSLNQSYNQSNNQSLHSSYPPARGYYQRYNSAAYPLYPSHNQTSNNQVT